MRERQCHNPAKDDASERCIPDAKVKKKRGRGGGAADAAIRRASATLWASHEGGARRRLTGLLPCVRSSMQLSMAEGAPAVCPLVDAIIQAARAGSCRSRYLCLHSLAGRLEGAPREERAKAQARRGRRGGEAGEAERQAERQAERRHRPRHAQTDAVRPARPGTDTGKLTRPDTDTARLTRPDRHRQTDTARQTDAGRLIRPDAGRLTRPDTRKRHGTDTHTRTHVHTNTPHTHTRTHHTRTHAHTTHAQKRSCKQAAPAAHAAATGPLPTHRRPPARAEACHRATRSIYARQSHTRRVASRQEKKKEKKVEGKQGDQRRCRCPARAPEQTAF